MKHHLYQLYFGGFKTKLKNYFFCVTCNDIIRTKDVKYKRHYKLKYKNWPANTDDK